MKVSVSLSCALITILNLPAQAGTAYLDSWSDGSSTYFEYFSDGFVRMDLYSPDETTHQSFHQISDPAVIYNQAYDGFPNDNFLRFGTVEYDESSLTNGTGTASVTSINLEIAHSPTDPNHENFSRFSTATNVSSFTGTVDVQGGMPVSMNLSADVELELTNVLGATQTGFYTGSFSVAGTDFDWSVHDTQSLDTFFGQLDVELEWDFQGTTLISADFDQNLSVNGADFLNWQRNSGKTSASLANGDANLDSEVDGHDLTIWQTQYGRHAVVVPPIVTAVPEPSTTTCAALGLAVLLGSIHRRRHPYNLG